MFQPQSDVIFIFLEFIYLLFCLFYIFNPLSFVRWFAYTLAGLKFSLSALDSFDMDNYRKVYEVVEGIGFEPVLNQEGAFTSLLYIAKITNISLTLFHILEIILFLYSISTEILHSTWLFLIRTQMKYCLSVLTMELT
jgi:hypothetical protein